MLPVLLSPRAALPVGPAGTYQARQDASLPPSGFEAELNAPPDDVAPESAWSARASDPARSRQDVPASEDQAEELEAREAELPATADSLAPPLFNASQEFVSALEISDDHGPELITSKDLDADSVVAAVVASAAAVPEAGALALPLRATSDPESFAMNSAAGTVMPLLLTPRAPAKYSILSQVTPGETGTSDFLPSHLMATDDSSPPPTNTSAMALARPASEKGSALADVTFGDSDAFQAKIESLQPPSGAMEGAVRFALSRSGPGTDALPIDAASDAPAAVVTSADTAGPRNGRKPPPHVEQEDAKAPSTPLFPRADGGTSVGSAVLATISAQDPTSQGVPTGDGTAPENTPLEWDLAVTATEGGKLSARPVTSAIGPTPLVSLPGTILSVVLAPVPGGMEIALSPAELGHLRIEIAPDGDVLRIVLSAERPETMDLLRRHADQLIAEVLEAGFSGAAMSFGSWGGQQGRPETPAPGQEFSPQTAGVAPATAAAILHQSFLPAHAGGLNLRL